MTRLVLAFFHLFAAPIRWLGADYDQFRAIVHTKLTLDSRRPMSGMHRRGGKKPTNAFAWTLVMYAFMGGMLATIVGQTPTPMVGMTLMHSFVMTMIALSLIADFTTVLLDTTDNAILQPRPVSSRTILVARTAHIITYLALLALSLSAVTFVVGAIKFHVLFPVVLFGTLICAVAMVVFVVQVFYLFAMRFTNAEKFRDIILYFQIGMTIVVFFGYQIIPRLLARVEIKSIVLEDRWWIYLYPPAWFAAPMDLLVGRTGTVQIVLTVLGVAVPLICLILVIRVLAPEFGRALARFDSVPSGQIDTHPTGMPRTPLARQLSRWVCRERAERASFEFVSQLCARDREFKQRTYPTFAFLVLLPVMWTFIGDGGFHAALERLPDTKQYLLPLYLACMLTPLTFMQTAFSSRHEAAWIYHAVPLHRPGVVLVATLKMTFVRFVIPAFVVVSVLVLTVWGFSITVDIVAAFSVTLFVSVLQAILFGRNLPFSKEFNVAQQAGHVGRSFLLMILPATFGGLHYLLQWISPWTLPAYAAVMLLAAVLLMQAYARTDWVSLGRGNQ